MQLKTIFTIATLSLGTSAAMVKVKRDTVAELHGYGDTGCSSNSIGTKSVNTTDSGNCQSFTSITIKSVNLDSISNGCNAKAYSDTNCANDEQDLSQGSCSSNDNAFKSFMVTCSS